MGLKLLPIEITENFEVLEWKPACAILKNDFSDEWLDLLDLLKNFKLCKSWIQETGVRKSKLAGFFDHFLEQRGWIEKDFSTSVKVDNNLMESPTHKVDCYKNRIALEIEWHNKDPFLIGI